MINDPQLETIFNVVCILFVLLSIRSLLDEYKEYRRLKGILEMLTKEREESERK